MDKVVSELSEIKRVLFRFTPSDISHSLFPIPFENAPIEYKVIGQRSNQREEKKKKKAKINKSKKKKRTKKCYWPTKTDKIYFTTNRS